MSTLVILAHQGGEQEKSLIIRKIGIKKKNPSSQGDRKKNVDKPNYRNREISDQQVGRRSNNPKNNRNELKDIIIQSGSDYNQSYAQAGEWSHPENIQNDQGNESGWINDDEHNPRTMGDDHELSQSTAQGLSGMQWLSDGSPVNPILQPAMERAFKQLSEQQLAKKFVEDEKKAKLKQLQTVSTAGSNSSNTTTTSTTTPVKSGLTSIMTTPLIMTKTMVAASSSNANSNSSSSGSKSSLSSSIQNLFNPVGTNN